MITRGMMPMPGISLRELPGKGSGLQTLLARTYRSVNGKLPPRELKKLSRNKSFVFFNRVPIKVIEKAEDSPSALQ